MRGHIYMARRGKYLKPITLSEVGIKWVDENENPTTAPKKAKCSHPQHWEWGNGTRNGQKLWYPLEELFYQKYHLTKKEFNDAVRDFDMASLEMRGRIICSNCAEKSQKLKQLTA